MSVRGVGAGCQGAADDADLVARCVALERDVQRLLAATVALRERLAPVLCAAASDHGLRGEVRKEPIMLRDRLSDISKLVSTAAGVVIDIDARVDLPAVVAKPCDAYDGRRIV